MKKYKESIFSILIIITSYINVIINIPIINILLFLLIIFLLFKIKNKKYLLVYSIIFTMGQVIGYNCNNYDSARLNYANTYIDFLSIAFILYIIMLFISNINIKNKYIKFFDKFFKNKYSFILVFVLIMFSWFIPLYALYPGVFAYDAGTQLRMVKFNALSKHHPIMHTIFLYVTIVLGGNLFKSYDIGLLIHSITQMTIMASIFTITLIYLYKKNFPPILITLFLMIYMFLPTHSVFAISTTKDVIFSGLFNLVFIYIYELSTNSENFLKSKRNIIILIILLFLLFSFRNNMIYAFIIFIPFATFILRKYYKKILLIFISSTLIWGAYDITLTKVFKIKSGPRIEMFGFVAQQYARVYNKEKLDKKDKIDIEKLFNNNSLENYNSHITDPVKDNFNSDILLNNKDKYLKLYIKLGLKYPLTYVDSLLDTTYGFFYLDEEFTQDNSKYYMGIQCLNSENNNFFGDDNCKKNNEILYNKYYNLLAKSKYQKIFILKILMNSGLYFSILIFVICKLLAKKELKKFVPVLLISLYSLTNIFAPVSIIRYMYPLLTTAPLLLFCIYSKKTED